MVTGLCLPSLCSMRSALEAESDRRLGFVADVSSMSDAVLGETLSSVLVELKRRAVVER